MIIVVTVGPMTTIPALGACESLTFHGPLSERRAQRLATSLAAAAPKAITDIGSGWAELLLRIVAEAPDAQATAIDNFGPDLERGRRNAVERGLADRVLFVEGEGADHDEPADLVLCIGAGQAFGETTEAATKGLRPLVKPGGRLLFGEVFWERTPTSAELANMWPDASADDHVDLPTLLGLAEKAGFTVLWTETANRDEWEAFESGFLYDCALWLAANGDHPEAPALRERVETHRHRFVRGSRDVMGFAYLTLGVPG